MTVNCPHNHVEKGKQLATQFFTIEVHYPKEVDEKRSEEIFDTVAGDLDISVRYMQAILRLTVDHDITVRRVPTAMVNVPEEVT